MRKCMNEITGGRSITRNQGRYILGDWYLKRSPVGTSPKCCVNSIELDQLGINVEGDDNNKYLQWENIKNYYYSRLSEYETDLFTCSVPNTGVRLSNHPNSLVLMTTLFDILTIRIQYGC